MSQQTAVLENPELKWKELEDRLAKIETAPQQDFEEPGFIRDLMPSKADVPLFVAGLGAGSAEAFSGFLQARISALSTYKPEYVQAIGGYLIYKYFLKKGGVMQYVSAFGGGMVIGAIGSLAQSYGLTLGRLGIHGSPGEVSQTYTPGRSQTAYSGVAV